MKAGSTTKTIHAKRQDLGYSLVLTGTAPRPALITLEWVTFLLCCCMYIGFSIWFRYTLQSAVVYAFAAHYWLAAASWFWLSAGPAALAVLASEIWQHRVELYEPEGLFPDNRITEDKHLSAVSAASSSAVSTAGRVESPTTLEQAAVRNKTYKKRETPRMFHVWLRVIRHQWRRSEYRLLVKPSSTHPYFLLVRAFVGLGRVAVFAMGSAAMGNILLMPIPQNLWLFIFLLFTCGVPRLMFPGFWSNSARGADLVVFVRPVGLLTGG